MRGLFSIPSSHDLIKAYERLQFHPASIKESDLALWSQWARIDPRLAEILISTLRTLWRKTSPVPLNEELKKHSWPMAPGPLLEQLKEVIVTPEEILFKKWCECVMDGISQASGEQFFIGLRSFASGLVFKDSFLALNFYRKWGYLSREILIRQPSLPDRTRLSQKTRRAALKELLKKKKRITVNDYINFLEHHVSRRQAELDLSHFFSLKKHGQTKGRTYLR